MVECQQKDWQSCMSDNAVLTAAAHEDHGGLSV